MVQFRHVSELNAHP